MRYRIDVRMCGHEKSVFCKDRNELLHMISTYKVPGTIIDIWKLYNSGVSDSVTEKYTRFFDNRFPQEVQV